MRGIAVALLFVGTFLILQGYYAQRVASAATPTVQVKYVPRSVYEEQLSTATPELSAQFRSLFEASVPGAVYTSRPASV